MKSDHWWGIGIFSFLAGFMALVYHREAGEVVVVKTPPPVLSAPVKIPTDPPVVTDLPNAPAKSPVRTSEEKWPKEFDEAIREAVTPELLSASSSVMKIYCPKWAKLSEIEKRQFYADVLYGVARYESNYNPISLFYEKDLPRDEVTGQLCISEGLLQLSYQDEKWAHCGFNYALDKAKHADDLVNRNKRLSWDSLHPDKTILDPIRNLTCGIKIFSFRMKRNPTKEFQANMGAYWSTIRDKTGLIITRMQARGSECF